MLNTKLWQQIVDFEITKPDVDLTFAQRFARENDFSELFSRQIITEYKKYIYLCCMSNQALTPSSYVDLAWHLHLTYTKSYWIDLCQNTLQKEIHHTPTEGGKAERDKFENYYNYTLKLYETEFKQKPPSAIWENTTDRFINNFVNVNKSKNWIIHKNKLLKYNYFYSVLVFIVFSLIAFVNVFETGTLALIIGIFIMVFWGFAPIVAKLFIILQDSIDRNDSINPSKHNNNNNGGCSACSGSNHHGCSGCGASGCSGCS